MILQGYLKNFVGAPRAEPKSSKIQESATQKRHEEPRAKKRTINVISSGFT